MEDDKVAVDDEEVVEDVEEEAIESGKVDKEKSPKATLRREPSFSRWCDENGASRSSDAADGSCEAGAPEDSDDFELPLLAAGGRSGDGSSPSTGNRSFDVFRSRSMPSSTGVHAVTANGNGAKYSSLDVESGLRISDSAAKLQTLEESRRSPISAGVVLRTLFFILLWYTFSTCLTVYNKMLLGNHLGKFPAPLLMNTIHFSMQAILSNVILYVQSRLSGSNRIKMTWKDYFVRVMPTALGSALDVNLSNESLVFISVTFATMCKSAAPIFLLIFAFAFRLETPSFKLVGIILVISVGVLLTVARETEFEFWGFLFVMLAAVMSGFRWCMTQILLQKEAYGLRNPITLMSYVTPIMAVLTAVLSIFLDPWHELKGNIYFDSSSHMIRSSLLMLLGGSLAFLMVLTEYILLSATSAVTVTVAGIVKEAVTILVAVFYFRDQFTWIKGSGLLVIMVGVSLFNWYKYQKMKSGEQTVYEGTSSVSANGSAKYVIIDDDIELQDDAN